MLAGFDPQLPKLCMQASGDPRQLSMRQCIIGYDVRLGYSSITMDMVNSGPSRVQLEEVLVTNWPQSSETNLTQCCVKRHTRVSHCITLLLSESHVQAIGQEYLCVVSETPYVAFQGESFIPTDL